MSEHEDASFDTGYSTPVPELDDHRHQSPSVQRPRSRRGTVDTLYSTGGRIAFNSHLELVNRGLLHPQARDFEEAVVDEESGGHSPPPGQNIQSRRGTVTTI